MKKLLLSACCLIISVLAFSRTIVVKNIEELNAANKQAAPGDIVILENGDWKNVAIALNCSGTKDQPITFKARTPGKVLITGQSHLKLGGNYIVVHGLYFVNGHAANNAVIDFKISKDQLANNCRVTNCIVDGFNNPRRMDENNWVSFSGRNNRVDNCSFTDKKNMGVLLAVLLDDDRSRQNYHSIDHNYFGVRVPLASNGGEIIRVGVSQHCEFNSNTNITDNFFDKCDGEAEVISIKSGRNVVRDNVFKECQGSLVLRHGDYNTVENNIFLGNGKEGTGGVRVINRGQWVVNNFFYKCRGVSFRSPMSIMNGVPNSPAHRYVQVTEAVIANNTFVDCAPISLCEGSDKERSLPPANVTFANNIFYNEKDSIIYRAFDDISGFAFSGNKTSWYMRQQTTKGFEKTLYTSQIANTVPIPKANGNARNTLPDSLQQIAQQRLKHSLSNTPGFSGEQLFKSILANAYVNCGADWSAGKKAAPAPVVIKCAGEREIDEALKTKEPVIIELCSSDYYFTGPLKITKPVTFIGKKNVPVTFHASIDTAGLFMLGGNGRLTLRNLTINGADVQCRNFISSAAEGSSAHYSLLVENCTFMNFGKNGCEHFFYAYKSMVADSIVLRNNHFRENGFNHIVMNAEKDDRGYYNAEYIILDRNEFILESGTLLNIYRGGNDESTLGPKLTVTNNSFKECVAASGPFIQLTGVQKSIFRSNTFRDSQPDGKLFIFKDTVRADHLLEKNTFTRSGEIQTNGFVRNEGNINR